jgi:lauroyl/myristoyl acyltransferase
MIVNYENWYNDHFSLTSRHLRSLRVKWRYGTFALIRDHLPSGAKLQLCRTIYACFKVMSSREES